MISDHVSPFNGRIALPRFSVNGDLSALFIGPPPENAESIMHKE